MSERDRFLERVRRAVAEGNRAGGAPPPEPRGGVGYQGAGPDPVSRFAAELAAAGGRCHVVADDTAAAAAVVEVVRQRQARRVLLGGGPVPDRLDLAGPLAALGVEVCRVADLTADEQRREFFAADVGVGGVDYLVAE